MAEWACHRRALLLSLVVLTLACSSTLGHKAYGDYIPNSKHVPHPCKPGSYWRAIGHILEAGKGAINQFGDDFSHKCNHTWTKCCPLDSDGDGKTNGMELGDPECKWSHGQPLPPSEQTISHPGICEPMESSKCLKFNGKFWPDGQICKHYS